MMVMLYGENMMDTRRGWLGLLDRHTTGCVLTCALVAAFVINATACDDDDEP